MAKGEQALLERRSSHPGEQGAFPGKTYAEIVLEPAYEQAKRHLLGPMIAVNKAHLIMLREQNLIAEHEANGIGRALLGLDQEKLRNNRYTGKFEDLFFEVEHELAVLAGERAGNLHLARSRNDMGIAIYRIVLRGKLLTVLQSALSLRRRLIDFARKHAETLMLGYTHTQQAQPTTVGHYIAAVSDSLGRDIGRLIAAYRNCNRSSLGAAALTTSGYAISRERTAELLDFDDLIVNAYDAVGGADYVGEIAAAVQLAAINLGRFSQELLLWGTTEFAGIRVADPYVQISSIMPQKRNPVSVEHLRSLLSACAGDAGTVLMMIHNTPFGDIVDTEDDLQPYVWRCLRTLDSVYRLLAEIVATLEVNREVLRARVKGSFATLTELADTLVRKEGLPFREAHGIVASLARRAYRSGMSASDLTVRMLNETALERIGRLLSLSEDELHEALDPERFVAIRDVIGGPNPQEVNRALSVQDAELQEAQEWTQKKQESHEHKFKELDRTIAGWFLD
nr:argininosuccinate lyase [Cohnella terricola]